MEKVPKGKRIDRMRARVEAVFRQEKVRPTEPRRLVIEAFLTAKDHVTVDGIRDQLRALGMAVGYSTIYRTMHLLVTHGIAVARQFEDDVTRYEVVDETEHHHDHLICSECGGITEFEEPRIEALQEAVAQRYGYVVTTHKHELYGVCASCLRKTRGNA